MKYYGFTLIELLITISVVALLTALALPNFSYQIQKAHTETVTQTLVNAIETARSKAVFTNQRTVLRAKEKWHQGWILFIDLNNNGTKEENERLLQEQMELKNIDIQDNFPVANEISFIGTGEGRSPGKRDRGAIIMGTITICPATTNKGIKLVLNRAGRLRSEKTEEGECSKT
jgi:type IV fimbrial biogenesis protein FimT